MSFQLASRLAHVCAFALCALSCLGARAAQGASQNAMDFRAAWGQNKGMLAQCVVYAGDSPALKWSPALDKLLVSVEVLDAVGNKVVLKKTGMKNGGILRDGPKALVAGLYKITYTANRETASEYFIIGSPKAVFENLKRELMKTSAPTSGARQHARDQIKQGEILFSSDNYNADNKTWQAKAVQTLGGLAILFTDLKTAGAHGKYPMDDDRQDVLRAMQELRMKSIIYTTLQDGPPAFECPPLLEELGVSIEVLDAVKDAVVVKRDNVKNGILMGSSQNKMPDGLYKITYTANRESANDYFIVGSPKAAFEGLKRELLKTSAPTSEARQNARTRIKQGEMLFSGDNYNADSKIWQVKAVQTLGSLATLFNHLKNAGEPGKYRLGDDRQDALAAMKGLRMKNSIYTASQDDSPAFEWNPVLEDLGVSFEVLDALKNTVILRRSDAKNGLLMGGSQKKMPDGLYKITYNIKQESASEYFIIGSPRAAFEKLRQELEKSGATSGGTRLNIEAQIRRGETLFARANYHADNSAWKEKVVYTLGSLASMAEMPGGKQQNMPSAMTGLHIKGFLSVIDGSRQFYRLFVPPDYDPARPLPLLIIMPTPFSARQRPFIESAFMAAHREAVSIGKHAEKHGFAVLWPGYKNPLSGWTYESTHVAEVLDVIARDYNIDESRISVHGTCGGGYFAGRLVATYPRRFAAIVYDKAIFEWATDASRNLLKSLLTWYKATNPAESVINNEQLGIFVLHDRVKARGHGEIELSEKFLETARKKRNDIKAHFGKNPSGESSWEMIFDWLASRRNGNPGPAMADVPRKAGFEGPISEVFASPFIVVRGTATGSAAARASMDSMVRHIKKTYAGQFYGAEPVVKNDYEMTGEELRDNSLILIGNPESNAAWKKLEDRIPIMLTPDGLFIEDRQFHAGAAFMAALRHPMSAGKRILAIGSRDLGDLGRLLESDPCRAWFDCRVFEPDGNAYKMRTISKLNESKP